MNQKKKISFVATVYRHLEAFHLPFMKLLQEKGYEIHAFARPDNGKKGVEEQGIVCHDIPFQRSPFHFDNIKALRVLVKRFKEEKFSMVHVHTPVASILGRIAARITDVPTVIYTAHGFHFFKGAPWLYWILYYPVERLMAHWTDFLITINEEDYQRAKNFKVKRKVLYVPGVGVDTSFFAVDSHEITRKKIREGLNLSGEDFVILYIAELNHNKNQLQIIETIHSLGEKGRGIKVFFAGDGDYRQQLEVRAKKFGLENVIYFLGYRKDIRELLIASDCVALLSKREGLPKALLEALAAGKPILATNVRGNRDLVVQNENGYLVPVGDIKATTDALIRLKEDPKRRKYMSMMSLKLAKKYDMQIILRKMEEIYDQVLH